MSGNEHLEGRQVDLTLRDGTRVEGPLLVSVGRLWAHSVWIVVDDADVFISHDDVVEIRESSRIRREAA